MLGQGVVSERKDAVHTPQSPYNGAFLYTRLCSPAPYSRTTTPGLIHRRRSSLPGRLRPFVACRPARLPALRLAPFGRNVLSPVVPTSRR
jgi:hypothetical protein